MSVLHSYHDLLQEYFDEGLDTVHEEVLFSELGRNGELRLEFSRMMRMHKTVQADVAHIKAPLAADDVFRRIAAPVPATPGTTLRMRRMAAFAATAVLAVLATTAVFLTHGLTISDIRTSPATAPVASEMQPRKPHLPAEESMAALPVDIPVVASSTIVREPIEFVRKSTESHNASPAVSDNQTELFATQDNRVAPTAFRSAIAHPDIAYSTETPIKAAADDYAFRAMPAQHDNGVVALSLRGIGVGGVAAGISEQISAGVLYEVNDTHAFGIEAGQEPFQSVSGVEVDGEVVEFRSVETLPWAMAVYRLSLPDIGIERTVYPFAQIGAGAARNGALGKAQFGLVLQPEHRVVFSLGVESTMLFRQHATPLATLRWTYGVSMKL